jgi:chemotaxis regulatin CheY-phosphate phosphatase CheZ
MSFLGAIMTTLVDLSEDDYLAMEEAVAATAKGRAFLRMRDKRGRVLSSAEIGGQYTELRKILERSAPAEPAPDASHLGILRRELQEMSAYVQQTRKEIAALRPDTPSKNRIVLATGELDAIVSATERATSEILSAAERIQAAAARIASAQDTKPMVDEINAQVIEILTACSFQDITGQRTTKVVNTLRYIETRINSMIAIWGTEGLEGLPTEEVNDDTRPDAHLLNGPALSGGVSQGEVDDMFGSDPITAPAMPAPESWNGHPAAETKPSRPVAAATPPPPKNGHASPVLADQNAVDALFN